MLSFSHLNHYHVAWLLCCINLLILSNNCLSPYKLRVEYESNPIGLDIEQPRFYWAVNNDGIRGDIQTSYQLIIYNTETNNSIIANTGKIKSNSSSQIVIKNFSIITHCHYKWTIQIWNKSDITSSLSIATSYFDCGLLSQNNSDWNNASWMYIPNNMNPNKNGKILNQFRTEFDINSSSQIKKAWCYIASPNYYRAYLNNIKTDKHVLGSFTTFEMTTYYEMFDCKPMLQINKRNVFGITIGNGWYSYNNSNIHKSINIGPPMVKIMIHMQFEDNSRLEFNSNNFSWYQGHGPIRMNDIYIGEWYDATVETDGLLLPYYDYKNATWILAHTINNPIIGKLKSSSIMPNIKSVESFVASNITKLSDGIYVFDFGQNVAGYCTLKLPGNNLKGYNITLTHSEEVNQSGYVVELYSISPMIATYTLKGDGNEEIYTPYFTWFGYQYVQIEGYPLKSGHIIPVNDTLISHFVHTDFDYIGYINFDKTSIYGNILNNIESMTRYSSLSNYMSLPTDCPQRERRGWLGDAQITMETVIYHWDIASSYTKYINDISDTFIFTNGTQGFYNALPDVAPWYDHGQYYPGDPSWTSAYVFFVYKMYKYFGDKRLIEQNYNSMKLFLSFLDSEIDQKTGLLPIKYSPHGDWCSVVPEGNNGCPHKSAMLNTYQYAKQYYYMSTLANIMGDNNDYKLFQMKLINAKKAIYDNFWDNNKGLFVDTTNGASIAISTLQAIGLDLNVLTDYNDIQRCVDNMVFDISVTNNGHLLQGIVGIKYILEQLCENNQCLVALNSSVQTHYVSYDFWYENGATTLWEHWQATRYNNHGGSKNHIMFGSQSAFYYRWLAGIRQTNNSVNWKEIIIDPFTNSTIFNINNIQSQINTLCGLIYVEWNIIANMSMNNDQQILWEVLDVTIPSGSIGFIYFRRLAAFVNYIDINDWLIMENHITIWKNMQFVDNNDPGIINGVMNDENTVHFVISSGNFSFQLYTQSNV